MTQPNAPRGTDLERDLLAAKNRGDRQGYLRLVGQSEVYLKAARHEVDAMLAGTETSYTLPLRKEADRQFMDLITVGEIPELDERSVLFGNRFEGLVKNDTHPIRIFVINPGCPSEWAFSEDELKWWLNDPDRPDCRWRDDVLMTHRGWPTRGPLAHGLACGLHLHFTNGVVWNRLNNTYLAYQSDVETMRDGWSITSVEGWQEQLSYLLQARNSDPAIDLVLKLRRQLAGPGPQVRQLPVRAWRSEVISWCREREIREDVAEDAVETVAEVLAYEERFRADGLLGEDAVVDAVAGYDFGRAVNLTRWGYSARFCDYATAERLIIRAGELAQSYYSSWKDFAAGYALGRVIRFDEGQFGRSYQQMVTADRELFNHPDSPWRRAPWRTHKNVTTAENTRVERRAVTHADLESRFAEL